MKFFDKVPNYDFFSKTKYFVSFSIVLFLMASASILTKGFNLGVDFKGGTLAQVQFPQKVSLEELRSVVESGFQREFQISRFGNESDHEVLVQFDDDPLADGKDVKIDLVLRELLQSRFGDIEIRRVETIGPKVGDELKEKAVYSTLLAILGILIYTAFRFKLVFGLGAIVCILHDVFMILGIFSVFGMTMSLSIIAALLTVVGYSLNDTIVVFDRIRENLAKKGTGDFSGTINLSVNETLSRTVMTSVSTLTVVLCLYFLGGDIIKNFSLSIALGVLIGTYSSVFIACPAVYYLRKLKYFRESA